MAGKAPRRRCLACSCCALPVCCLLLWFQYPNVPAFLALHFGAKPEAIRVRSVAAGNVVDGDAGAGNADDGDAGAGNAGDGDAGAGNVVDSDAGAGQPSDGVVLEYSLAATAAPPAAQGDFQVGFFATTEKTRSLYRGCRRLQKQPPAGKRGPDFIIIGVHKGGTSSILNQLGKFACPSTSKEPHLFDDDVFWNRSIQKKELAGYFREWNCSAPQPRRPRFEKSPNYYVQPWAAQRICESLPPRQKLVIFLRNPIDRAYSGFYFDFPRDKSMKVQRNPQGFDELVGIETMIVKECGGLPTQNLTTDFLRQPKFKECCNNVTSLLGYPNWLGCSCAPSGMQRHNCGVFGLARVSQIRMGIYSRHLSRYFLHHRADDLLIYRSEDVFDSMPRVAWELVCLTKSNIAPQVCRKTLGPKGQPGKLGTNVKKNSASKGQENMLAPTRERLASFYAPFNKELEELLGHDMRWT